MVKGKAWRVGQSLISHHVRYKSQEQRGWVLLAIDVRAPHEPTELRQCASFFEIFRGQRGLREYCWQLVWFRSAGVFDQFRHPLTVFRFLVLIANPIHLCVRDHWFIADNSYRKTLFFLFYFLFLSRVGRITCKNMLNGVRNIFQYWFWCLSFKCYWSTYAYGYCYDEIM